MPKSTRLTRKHTPLLRGARRLHSEFFALSVAPGEHTKASVTVSKKVAAKASERNLIKRRARALLSPQVKELKASLVLMLHAKPAAKDASFDELKRDIRKLFTSFM